jgi:penicillin amidase
LVLRAIALAVLILLAAIAVYGINAFAGMETAAQASGSLRVAGLSAPVQIIRDDRGIPHIRAQNENDLFFAQGFAEGSDRLFQMDFIRRYVYGRLAEVVGPPALHSDENARIVDIRGIVARQWLALGPRDRAMLQSFSNGVNAAMQKQPLPVEFRLLLYRPEPWKPQDSLAAGMATVLDLIDTWDDVIRRDGVAKHLAAPLRMIDLYTITDPAYDAPIAPPRPAPVPPLHSFGIDKALQRAASIERAPIGSNEWAVGANHSATGRALLANDPHLRLGIPGVWYLVDLQSPHFHVAGGTLPGTPGVILGHNENVAWGATNATVVTEVVYRTTLKNARTRPEIFHVRFGRDARVAYKESVHGFVAQTDGTAAYSVDWNAATLPHSPVVAFAGLDHARSVSEALAALQKYPGPPQNFVVADRSGAAAYHVAGLIPNDPSWGLKVHAAADPHYPYIGFQNMPHVAASRDAILFTANNRTYGAGYPYRLSPSFGPPYRAARIKTLLHSKKRFGIADMAAFQSDTLSAPERDFARATLAALRRKGLGNDRALSPYIAALAHWNGRFDGNSRGGAIVWETRRIAVAEFARALVPDRYEDYQASAGGSDFMLMMRLMRQGPALDTLLVKSFRQAVEAGGPRLLAPWSEYGRVIVHHPLNSLGFSFLNGATLPGDGDRYAVHVQTATSSQSFRAVWDVGNWDAGGMAVPSGESGEPGSGHYTDQSPAWIAQRLVPLPFSDRAVRAAARATLTLQP